MLNFGKADDYCHLYQKPKRKKCLIITRNKKKYTFEYSKKCFNEKYKIWRVKTQNTIKKEVLLKVEILLLTSKFNFYHEYESKVCFFMLTKVFVYLTHLKSPQISSAYLKFFVWLQYLIKKHLKYYKT